MKHKPKYLTKSRFKLALECPTRVRFALDHAHYANQKSENPFLLALADGGFQVGEMAKLHYPLGKDCKAKDNEVALEETNRWIEEGESVIFEAALKSGFKYIRVDILEITDTEIRVIEVKSKSVKGSGSEQMFGKRGKIDSTWRPYLEDVAFQVCVTREYFSSRGINLPVRGFLMCPDKTKKSSIDGLHEHFVIRRDHRGRAFCEVNSELTISMLGESMMSVVDANLGVEAVISDTESYGKEGWECTTFEGAIHWLEDLLKMNDRGLKIPYLPVGQHCASCSFTTPNELTAEGKISGRRECFERGMQWDQVEFEKPKVWDVWNLRSKRAIIEEGRWFMHEMTEDDFKQDLTDPTELSDQDELPRAQRQWIQISASRGEFKDVYLDTEGLEKKISKFNWPLHFIDFETTAPAIPFYKGYVPYQGVSFQFSHHVLHEDGTLKHAGQFLGPGLGNDPTYEFVEALYGELSQDDGSVFMYSHHENTYLNYAHSLLRASSPFDEVKTKKLLAFLESLTWSSGVNMGLWDAGDRVMIDMAKLVRSHFWHPDMSGSNSIKAVLPAVLNASKELQVKYMKPIYGTSAMPSLNRSEGYSWIVRKSDGKVEDPYALLPKIGQDSLGEDLLTIERLYAEDKVGNGGAAMTAWSFMQFAQMADEERRELLEALKHYCELDTIAMAFIMEYFLIEISKQQKQESSY